MTQNGCEALPLFLLPNNWGGYLKMQTLQKRLAWKMGLKREECTDDEQEEIGQTIIME